MCGLLFSTSQGDSRRGCAHACQALTRLLGVCQQAEATHHFCGSGDRPGGLHLIVVCKGLAGTAEIVVCNVEHLTTTPVVVVVCMIQQ